MKFATSGQRPKDRTYIYTLLAFYEVPFFLLLKI
jgi:hypothetical protein